jgi:hypothetical protein
MSEPKLPSGVTRLTPAERTARAKLAANARWAKTKNRTVATQPARDALLRKFENQIDPAGTMHPDERVKRAENLKQEHLARMRFQALKARRAVGAE